MARQSQSCTRSDFCCMNALLVALFKIFENERIHHFCFRLFVLMTVSFCLSLDAIIDLFLFKQIRIQISLAMRLNHCWYF